VQASTNAGLPGTQLADDFLQQGVELRVDGELAGWLVRVTPGQQAMGEAEARFLDDTGDWLAAAAIGAVALAIFVSVAFAHQLARPLRALTGAARDLAAGALGKQVSVKGADEVVELADAFNQMSHDLAEGEALRRRMTADIAHELRTPISIMRGHLEAMLDGVYPADPEHLAVAHDQTLQLARLVEDLRLLTLAEAGRLTLDRAAIAPGELVAKAAERFSPLAVDAGLTLTHAAAPGTPPVYVDVGRMHQVLANLLSNALHHTPVGGRVDVQTAPSGEAARFSVSNTGKGLTPEQTKRVFERFWRAEDARERDLGGSGLGLAIAQQLVNLHGGRIWVESDSDHTTFIFEISAHST
jgi:signal transduction histidine kinase